MKYFTPPVLIQKIFNSFIWETSNNKILLTFDDGPTEVATLKILDVLKSIKIRAVFFCVGNNVKNHPGLTEKILESQHTIANHTMNHELLLKMGVKKSISAIEPFNILLKKNFNYDVKYFRPPHGLFNFSTKRVLAELNLKCVMWNPLTYDFKNNFKLVEHSITNYLNKNSILVFHDSIKSCKIIERSLNFTVEQIVKKGFEFGVPEDCLK